MAKSKGKSNNKSLNTKKNIVSDKNTNVNVNLNKKNRNTKKKIVVPDEVKKEFKEVEIIKKPTKKKTTKKVVKDFTEGEVLTQGKINLQKKERNRKKYENQQKKYQDAKKTKTKKKIVVPDEVEKKGKKLVQKEEKLVKKSKKESKVKEKDKERKEKRKFNRKSINITQTLVNIKDKSVNGINLVKEKANDKNIPVGKSEEEKKKRFKRIIKEAIVYAILLTIINMISVLVFDYFNFLRLFDVKALNVVVTIILSLLFNFFIAFMIDYFVTEIWLRRKRKKEVDDIDGNKGTIEGEYQEDITNKEGE